MIKCIYVQVDNLEPLLEWLRSKPEGQLRVLVGGTSDSIPFVLKYLGSDYVLARWIYDKTIAGEFEIQSLPEGTDLPLNIVIEI